jgi:uncharacterized protein YkwD
VKRRRLLKAILRCRSAGIIAGLLWAATIACAGPSQAQTLTKPEAATAPGAGVQAAQNTSKSKLAKSGVWHRFGESEKGPGAGAIQPGLWHCFGPNPGGPKVGPGETAPQQNLGGDRMQDLERQMWALVNHDRLDPGTSGETGGRAQPLRWNENLAAVARAHSRIMLGQGFFDHVDPDGRTLSTRLNEAGIPWQAAGENIAIYGTIQGAQAAFMDEPRFQHNHRGNVLNANYTDVGIGIVKGSDGSLYITEDFAAIPPTLAPCTSESSRGRGGGS